MTPSSCGWLRCDLSEMKTNYPPIGTQFVPEMTWNYCLSNNSSRIRMSEMTLIYLRPFVYFYMSEMTPTYGCLPNPRKMQSDRMLCNDTRLDLRKGIRPSLRTVKVEQNMDDKPPCWLRIPTCQIDVYKRTSKKMVYCAGVLQRETLSY